MTNPGMDGAAALAIVQELFGLCQPLPGRFKGHRITQIYVNDDADRKNREATARKRLDEIDWQMIVLEMHDETAYRPMNDKLASSLPNGSSLNVYGLAPLEPIEPRPPVVYHATETKIAQELDCLRPS